MKRLLIAMICLLVASTASAAGLSLGIFDGKEYILQPESVRFCSTPSCIYIAEQPQSYVAASIMVLSAGPMSGAGDALSYDKRAAYDLKKVLFAADWSKFVLVQTINYDVNGNPIASEDNIIEMIEVETVTIAKNKETGNETTVKEKAQERRRKIAWSVPQPGSPGEKITRAVMSFAESNYYDILSRSKNENSMSAQP